MLGLREAHVCDAAQTTPLQSQLKTFVVGVQVFWFSYSNEWSLNNEHHWLASEGL